MRGQAAERDCHAQTWVQRAAAAAGLEAHVHAWSVDVRVGGGVVGVGVWKEAAPGVGLRHNARAAFSHSQNWVPVSDGCPTSAMSVELGLGPESNR